MSARRLRVLAPLVLLAAAAAAAPSAADLPAAPPELTGARVEAAVATTPAQAVARQAGAEAVWVGWSLETVPGGGRVCCGWRDGRLTGCSLSGDDRGWSSGDATPAAPRRLHLLAEARGGRVQRLRAFSPGCAIDGAGRRVVWLGEVAAGPSLDLLEPLLDAPGEELAERALATVAYHADPRADRILERRALDPRLDGEAREHAIFWAGHLRGAAGYRLADRVLTSETDGELREHALFALSQSPEPAALDRLKRAAVEDGDPEVRGQGLFWLAQADAPGAGEWIHGRLAAESDEEVREQAVFALSQLDDGADWLLRLLRTSRDPEVVRQALFWLGESDDPRALAELEKILAR